MKKNNTIVLALVLVLAFLLCTFAGCADQGDAAADASGAADTADTGAENQEPTPTPTPADPADSTEEETGNGIDSEAMYEAILAEFVEIAKVPRGSSHTEQISDYLLNWGEDHGFVSEQDEVGNVRWEVPATAGYENMPLTALQVHMDMVTVSDDGRDMLTSPIVVVEDKENGIISSDGHTSLGSDDGIGIASAMYLAVSDEYVHGPIRVIITINEEGGSPSGTGNMDPAWVADAQYMVNIDAEDYATCTVAACGFAAYMYDIALESEAAAADKVAYTIDLHDLKGGHSGVDIDKNRANAIKAVDYCLAWSKYKGIDIQIASFTGGTGMTAIPALASATVVFSPEYEELFKAEMDKTISFFAGQYDRTEEGYTFEYIPAELPEQVLTLDCSANIIDFIAAVEDGVNTVSQRYAGITESSFNLGTVSVIAGEESTSLTVPMRLSAAWPGMLANMQFQALANAFGVTITSWSADPYEPENISLGWVEKEGDTIAQMYKRAFEEFTGDTCEITAVHGGLECADFAEMNPDLQIIAVGPTIESPHSVHEYIEIDTIPTTCGAIATLLTYIANGITE